MITRIRIAGALAVAAVALGISAPRAAAAADYFPLKTGNSWTYTTSGPSGGDVTTTVDYAWRSRVTGAVWYHLDTYQGDSHWVRETAGQRVYEWQSSLWYRFGMPAGTTWPMAMNGGLPGSDGATLTLASRSETVQVRAGTFRGCIRIDYATGVADAGVESEWFAPGVGLVKRTESRIWGVQTTELKEATVNGRRIAASGPPLVATITIAPGQIVIPGAPPPPGANPNHTFQVQATLHVAATGAPVQVTEGGFHVDFVVTDASGRQFYKWSDGKAFAMYLRYVTIDQAGVDYTETLELTNPPIGDLTVEGIAAIHPAPANVSAKLTVIPGP